MRRVGRIRRQNADPLMARLLKSQDNTARGADYFLREKLRRVRYAGATELVI